MNTIEKLINYAASRNFHREPNLLRLHLESWLSSSFIHFWLIALLDFLLGTGTSPLHSRALFFIRELRTLDPWSCWFFKFWLGWFSEDVTNDGEMSLDWIELWVVFIVFKMNKDRNWVECIWVQVFFAHCTIYIGFDTAFGILIYNIFLICWVSLEKVIECLEFRAVWIKSVWRKSTQVETKL